MPWREPKLLKGDESLEQLKQELIKFGIKRVLIVTDQGIVKAGLLDILLHAIESNQIEYHIYDQTVANPTIKNIEEAYMLYKNHDLEAIIGYGGGSPIDAAKGVGIRVAKPKTPFSKMKGILKVRKKLPLLIAIPTTAGTGSEATLASVISNPDTHEKYAISDFPLIPKIAVLDPTLTLKLPKFYTATTGMDALTHAVEAYIGRGARKEVKKRSLLAIKFIHSYLKKAYDDPSNMIARTYMLDASYHAGYAFTRAYVGNIHAIAHTFGGSYNIPHGYANAIIMPHVLTYYGSSIYKKLSCIYDVLFNEKDDKTMKEKALHVISWIFELNQYFNIPSTIEIPDKLQVDDMVNRAYKEANPLYPVPVIFSKKDFKTLYNTIINVKSPSN
jgi:alcohol dehydrogenase class IV